MNFIIDSLSDYTHYIYPFMIATSLAILTSHLYSKRKEYKYKQKYDSLGYDTFLKPRTNMLNRPRRRIVTDTPVPFQPVKTMNTTFSKPSQPTFYTPAPVEKRMPSKFTPWPSTKQTESIPVTLSHTNSSKPLEFQTSSTVYQESREFKESNESIEPRITSSIRESEKENGTVSNMKRFQVSQSIQEPIEIKEIPKTTRKRLLLDENVNLYFSYDSYS